MSEIGFSPPSRTETRQCPSHSGCLSSSAHLACSYVRISHDPRHFSQSPDAHSPSIPRPAVQLDESRSTHNNPLFCIPPSSHKHHPHRRRPPCLWSFVVLLFAPFRACVTWLLLPLSSRRTTTQRSRLL